MPFFEYNQNNSGGSFHIDEEAGISTVVIVEAEDANAADRKAEEIGLYFDGDGDCSCCGDRWYAQGGGWNDDAGDLVPSIYGEPVSDIDFSSSYRSRWADGAPEVYVHFANGTVQGYGFTGKQL
ncbi:hypothetical protein SEA_DEXERS_66 [Streptomyces phage Dexers]|uniref:DUF7296 domain-containing protein n=1 Tax=Streptomyces phage Alsaber TaxID=2053672 RepID=A0A2H4PGH9_9CAUD|nr:hypothetical protein KGG97_gp68 [Streptomyces phage Alsaber]ATW61342.1 hypothetical protein SEA_ALSABER_68 [Streptomyces phage Alsaber]WMI34586.1 hypothetical protein SEA_DEXERS_66 [Streptomyces phage Dexers]